MASRPGPHAIFFVLVTVLLDTIGFGLVLPVLPELIVELTGEGLSQAAVYGGWLAFVYAVLQFTFAPVLGNLSDRFGRRPVLLYAVASLGTDYIVMGLAPTLGWLFLGRAIAGIAGASFTPAYAYIADVTPAEKRAQQFGLIGAAFGTGFIIGPAIGGLLGELGPRAPFFAAAALSLLNFTYGIFVLPESLPVESRRPFDWKRANPLGTLLQIRKYPVVLGLLTALFLWQIAHQVMPSTWAYYTMFRFGWSEAIVGASLAFVGVIMAVSQATLPRLLIPRLGEATCATIGLTFGGLGFLGYGLATRGWMMFALMFTWFLGAIVMPSTQALMSHRIPPSAQGELQGGVASLYGLSSIIGPPVMTQLFGYFSSDAAPVHAPGAAFLFAAALAAGSLMLFRRAVRVEHPHVVASASGPRELLEGHIKKADGR
jgi:DHA1 family tetracycline resistance protein-like MFS transporter